MSIYTGIKLNTTQTIVLYGANGRAMFVDNSPSAPVEARAKSPKADKGKDCACGCGGRTKGGTWMPGHDAIHAAKEAGFAPKGPKVCRCGCEGLTKGGMFKPGHDAKHYSAMRKAEGTQAA